MAIKRETPSTHRGRPGLEEQRGLRVPFLAGRVVGHCGRVWVQKKDFLALLRAAQCGAPFQDRDFFVSAETEGARTWTWDLILMLSVV